MISRELRYLFIILYLLASLNTSGQAEKLYLNPATAGSASQSKFTEITRFIPVDAASEKISSNTSLIQTSRYWILYEYMDKKLYFLNKQGKLLKTVSFKKYGNAAIIYDEKTEVLRFNIPNKHYTLLEKDLVDIRTHYAKKSNQKYFKNYEIDLKDENLQIKKTVTDPYYIINAYWLYEDYYYLTDLKTEIGTEDSLGHELILLQNFKPVKSFFSYNKTANNIFRYVPIQSGAVLNNTDTPYVKYLSRLFNTTIYRLEKDMIEPVYELILPIENAIPGKYLKNGFRSKTDWENFQNSHGAVFYSISSIQNLQRYLFFSIKYMRNYESFLYDKAARKFYKTKMIKPDSSQYNIQLLQYGPGSKSGEYYYTLIPAQTLLDFYSKNKEKNITYPPDLEAYLKTATKNSNPVVVEYKIKE